MSGNRQPFLAFAVLCAVALVGIAMWRSGHDPVKPTDKAASQASKPILDTNYRPAPLPADEAPDQALRPALAELLRDGTPLGRRIEILESTGSDLTQPEAMTLLRELSSIPPQEENSAAHSSYIHQLCNLLQKVTAVRDDFASALATVAATRELPVVYRDYACQHLRMLWRGSRDEADNTGRPRMVAIENTFRSMLQSQPETAAQSLLGLHEIRESSGDPAVPDKEISAIATSILGASPSQDSIPARMTAVRVLAERRIPESGAMLRAIATSEAEHSLVRASAVAALGFIGDPSDLEFLSSLPANDPVIAGALRHATGNR
jgi:hypothetical protein